jgi:serine/threonine protein kinase
MSASVGRTRVGRYELGRTLGEGTFAKVKFARNVETGENVAIKILDKEKVLKHKMIAQVKSMSCHAMPSHPIPSIPCLGLPRPLFLLRYVFPVPFSSFFSPLMKIRARTKKLSIVFLSETRI